MVNFNATTSASGQYRSPFELTAFPSSPYTYVQSGGQATYNVGGVANYLELIWGSPDPSPTTYNLIKFYNGATEVASVNASQIPPSFVTALENVFVKISFIPTFTSFVVTASQNAFEYSGVSWAFKDPVPDPTPIPGAAFLMGSVLAGGAGFGAWRRRRKAA